MAYSVFVTYNFEGAPYAPGVSIGINESIHCNYIQKLETDTLAGKDLNFFFDSSQFPFLNDMSSTGATGWTATKMNAIVQIVNATGTTATTDPSNWKIVEVTSQLVGHTSGDTISQSSLDQTVFKLTFAQINAAPLYTLDYIDNPSATSADDNALAFGEEAFFFGNVKTDIGATVYTTDIAVQLPLNEYNSTTNPTWDGISTVYVSEVGIYDANNTLLAIGKLNYPVDKNSTKFRTIVFSIDF